MLAMITSEELECRDILNDIGIFFSEDCDLLEAELSALDDDFKAIVSPSEFLSTPVAPVSPTPSAEALEHLIAPLVPNPISSCPPARLAFYSPQPLLPVLPSIMPHQTMSSNPGITIQRAVSDISMTTAPVAKIIMPTANATISRKRSLQGMLQVDLDPEEQVRRKRNREHAKKSRQRKKTLTDELTSSLEALREESEKLRQELYKVIGEDEVNGILEARRRKEQEDFIAMIQKPENRVVDASTLKFLKGLSKKLPTMEEEN